MYPWLWLWAPQFRFPFSGSVAQDYEPNTEWFFGAISPSAGNGKVERRAFEVASYGRQIGLLTEALLAQNQQGTVTPEQGAMALERLTDIRNQIEKLKAEEAQTLAKSLKEQLERLRRQHPEEFQRLAKVFA